MLYYYYHYVHILFVLGDSDTHSHSRGRVSFKGSFVLFFYLTYCADVRFPPRIGR